MLAPHNAEGCFPGLGESLISEALARGVVSEKSRRSLDESRGMLAQALEWGRIINWKTDCQQRILAGWHERNTNPC
jgi:hypothetical protein